MLERLQKIISAAGITSRRAAEELIAEGRVKVNGKLVTELGTKADASKDHIKVDGKLINPRQPLTYIMLNKPAGFVTTMSDPERRPTVQDLLQGVKVRVYPVGRLDYNTEGLLLMTNDGDFAHLITHPKHEFPKTYLAKVKGVVDEKALNELEQGVYLDDGKTAPAKIKKIRKEEANSWLEITIHEGRKRQVRRMFDRVGHSVIKLKRVRTGTLTLGDLQEGSYRHLTTDEVSALKDLSGKADAGRERPRPSVQPGYHKTETKIPDRKKAHKGRTPDLRPGRTTAKGEEGRKGHGFGKPGKRGTHKAPGRAGKPGEGMIQSTSTRRDAGNRGTESRAKRSFSNKGRRRTAGKGVTMR